MWPPLGYRDRLNTVYKHTSKFRPGFPYQSCIYIFTCSVSLFSRPDCCGRVSCHYAVVCCVLKSLYPPRRLVLLHPQYFIYSVSLEQTGTMRSWEPWRHVSATWQILILNISSGHVYAELTFGVFLLHVSTAVFIKKIDHGSSKNRRAGCTEKPIRR